MKRVLLIFLVVASLLFSSCYEEKYNVLPFEGKDVIMECTVNEKFDVVIEKRKDALYLSVLSPKEISGVSFSFSPEGDKMLSGDVSVPISKDSVFGIYALVSITELSESKMTSAVSNDGVGEISIEQSGLLYTLIFSNLDYYVEIKKLSII